MDCFESGNFLRDRQNVRSSLLECFSGDEDRRARAQRKRDGVARELAVCAAAMSSLAAGLDNPPTTRDTEMRRWRRRRFRLAPVKSRTRQNRHLLYSTV